MTKFNRVAPPLCGVIIPTLLILAAFSVVSHSEETEYAAFDYSGAAKQMEAANHDVWKWLSVFMAGNLMSGLVGFFTLHRRIVTVAEVREIVLKESPFNQERSGIYQRLDMLKDDDLELKTRIDRLEKFLFENRNEMMELFSGVSSRIDAVKTDIHNGFMAIQRQLGNRNGFQNDD